jgi:hypothetical protein
MSGTMSRVTSLAMYRGTRTRDGGEVVDDEPARGGIVDDEPARSGVVDDEWRDGPRDEPRDLPSHPDVWRRKIDSALTSAR